MDPALKLILAIVGFAALYMFVEWLAERKRHDDESKNDHPR